MASGSTAAPRGLQARVTALWVHGRTSRRFPRVPRSPAVLTASSSSQRYDFASLWKTTSPGSLSERSAPAGPVTAGRTTRPGRKGSSAGFQGGGRQGKSPPHLPGEGQSTVTQRWVCFWLLSGVTGGGSLPSSRTSPRSHKPSQKAHSLPPSL